MDLSHIQSDLSRGRKGRNWWLVDELVFLEELRKTAVGKFLKKELRTQFED